MTKKPIEIINSLLDTKAKRSQKKIIKDAWKEDAEYFFYGISLSMDPAFRINLEKIPEIQDIDDGSPGDFSFNDFLTLTEKLRKLEGRKAKELVYDAANKANISEWNLFYRRILLKTLTNYLPMDLIKETLSELTIKKNMLSIKKEKQEAPNDTNQRKFAD